MFESIPKLTFYLVDIGNTRFLCGIKFTTNPETTKLIGYKSEVSSCHHANTSSMLKGYTVAIGPRGVQAIRFHSS